MSQVNYRSTRLLIDAIRHEMETIRKAAMGNMALGSLNDLRDMIDQLAKKAERVALDDLPDLAPADYVSALKPVVAEYHRTLMNYNQLAPCLCMDLRAAACVVILVGDGNSVVRTAHDPGRPDAALIVETILAKLDDGTKQVAVEAAAAAEAFAGVDAQVGPKPAIASTPLTLEGAEACARETLGHDHPEDGIAPRAEDCAAGQCDCFSEDDRTP